MTQEEEIAEIAAILGSFGALTQHLKTPEARATNDSMLRARAMAIVAAGYIKNDGTLWVP